MRTCWLIPIFAVIAARPSSADDRAESLHPAVQLSPAAAADINGRHFDLIVVEATPAGIACAVRAAREGAEVLLVNHTQHIGGMVTNGLVLWDARYAGWRAPIFDELIKTIETHYRTVYGTDSPDYERARLSQDHHPLGMVEPHVAERELNRLVAREQRITLLLAQYPSAVECDGATLRSVTLRAFGGNEEVAVRAEIFVDASYEGDLLALAKVPYRVGREARDEYDEPHAGKLFSNTEPGAAPLDAVEKRLNIRPYILKQGSIDPTSPFTADGAIQAYNYRFCVTNNPANRLLLEKPPPNYRREEYVDYNRKRLAGALGPNAKSTANMPRLPGENHDYPEADWVDRQPIIRRHLEFALGLMWFLQHDESVPLADREQFREWGLPLDEYGDHGHVPYEMYVREARRLVGRTVLTEHDFVLAPGFARTPIHPDSVAITDWYIDIHACTNETRPGYAFEGQLILSEESRPGQIPYRAMLAQQVDNLLVPVCLSATHVAWGAVRVEPTLMAIGESAGFAAALSLKHQTPPARLDPDLLVRKLAMGRVLISFFNDIDVDVDRPWQAAVQYFGTRGFFHDYNARMGERLKRATGQAWARGLGKLRTGQLDADVLAREIAEAERDTQEITVAEFAALLPSTSDKAREDQNGPLMRETAVQWMWELINRE